MKSPNSKPTAGVANAPKSICVLFPGALGDFICFLPALQQLAATATVALLGNSDFVLIAPLGVQVSSLERFEVHRLFANDGGADPRVHNFFGSFTAVYSWFASQQSGFVDQLQVASGGRAKFFPFRPASAASHQADYYLGCLKLTRAKIATPLVALQPEAIVWCNDFLCRRGLVDKPLLVLAPGSGAREKNWPAGHYAQVAQWWRRQMCGEVVAIVGPVEAERRGLELLAPICCLASGLDLAQLAALLARGDVVIGNDSGVAHLAAAVDARVVAIFGPSDERQWAPRGPRVTILRHALACAPCGGAAMKLCGHHSCLTEITPEEVIHELRKPPEIANLTTLGVGITV